MKRCSKCKTERDKKQFNKCKGNSDGLQKVCKICQKEWRDNNKEYIKKYNTEYYIKNEEKLKEYDKKYNIENKDKRKKYHDEYRIINSSELKERKRKYNTSEEGKETRRKWRLNDYKKSPYKYIVYHILHRTLRYLGKTKSNKTIEILGYSPDKLKF